MRIGEIKNSIEKVLDDNHQIVLNNDVLFGGQAYKVNNFSEITEALSILSGQEWNNSEYSQVEAIIDKYETEEIIILTTEEFNQLHAYISVVNSQIPMYYSVLKSLTEEQDEKTINIKLPPQINSLDDLNKFNKRLDIILKRLNIDGSFEFKGFDKGTEWYVLVPLGILSYHYILAILKIAQEYFKTKKIFYESEEAKISYEASLRDTQESTVKGFTEYQEKRLEIFIHKKN